MGSPSCRPRRAARRLFLLRSAAQPMHNVRPKAAGCSVLASPEQSCAGDMSVIADYELGPQPAVQSEKSAENQLSRAPRLSRTSLGAHQGRRSSLGRWLWLPPCRLRALRRPQGLAGLRQETRNCVPERYMPVPGPHHSSARNVTPSSEYTSLPVYPPGWRTWT